jgi:hypothetical protein
MSLYHIAQAQSMSHNDIVQTVDRYYDVFDGHIRHHTRLIVIPRLKYITQQRLWHGLQRRLEDVIATL